MGAQTSEPTTPPAADSSPNWSQRFEVVVVGAGIAGLAAAWHLRDRKMLVLEAANRVGGRIRSEQRDPYWLNLGPHLFPPPETSLGKIAQSLGIETRAAHGTAMAIWSRGKLVPDAWSRTDPLRLALPVSARLSLARLQSKLRRAVGEYLQLERQQVGEDPAEVRARLLAYCDGESFASFLGPIAPAADAILRAAVNRVSAEPEELSAGAGVAQFAGTFTRTPHASFFNVIGGTSVLPEKFSAVLGSTVVTGARVTRVRGDASGPTIDVTVGSDQHRVHADYAILATPAYVTRRILDDQPEELAGALGTVAYGPYVVGAFLTAERGATAWDDIYAMAVAGKAFNMFFNTVNVLRTSTTRAPGGSVTVYGAARLGRALVDKSDGEVIDVFLRDLDDIFPELRQHIVEALVQRWDAGIAFSRPGRHGAQPALERPFDRVYLTGDYVAARAGMDTAAEISEQVARNVRAALSARGPSTPGAS